MAHQNALRIGLWAVCPLASLCGSAAVLVDTSPGTGVPPAVLGGYTMNPAGSDPRPEFTITTTAPTPGGALTFAPAVELNTVGSGWHTWSHGYTGSVYWTADEYGESFSDLLIDLPPGTLAFYLYVQPNLKADFGFEVTGGTATESVTGLLTIHGDSGARYIGFYTDDPGAALHYIRILQSTEDSDGFAVGEFGIYVPEPALCGLLTTVGLLGFAALRRVGKN